MKTASMTIKQLREKAKAVRAAIEVDEDCVCYRATANPGFCFEDGLHELVEPWGNSILGNGNTRTQAKNEMAERLDEYEMLGGCQPCEIADCDWCNDN